MNRLATIDQSDFERAFKSPYLDLVLKIMRNTYGLEALQVMPSKKSPLSLVIGNREISLTVGVDSVMSSWILNNESWSEKAIEFIKNYWLKNRADETPVVVDIGAHQGFFSRQLYSIFKGESNIYCFEPDKKNFEILVKNVGNIPTCKVYNVGLSDKPGNLNFYRDRENHGNYSLNRTVVPTYGKENNDYQQIVKVENPRKYEVEILSHNAPIIYKSDTQSFDCVIATQISENFWDRTEIAVLELWRTPFAPFFDRSIFRKIVDKFPYKYFDSDLKKNINADDIFTYLNGADWKGVDLFMHK
jgi:FkbM family methyltransferase